MKVLPCCPALVHSVVLAQTSQLEQTERRDMTQRPALQQKTALGYLLVWLAAELCTMFECNCSIQSYYNKPLMEPIILNLILSGL